MSSAHSVVANFAQLFSVSVTNNNSGLGTVTSQETSPLIDCGSSCSHNYASGTSITLTATPNAGAVFFGWVGGPCNGSFTPTCTFSVSAATSMTARFFTACGDAGVSFDGGC
jgi:hypothetical protein